MDSSSEDELRQALQLSQERRGAIGREMKAMGALRTPKRKKRAVSALDAEIQAELARARQLQGETEVCDTPVWYTAFKGRKERTCPVQLQSGDAVLSAEQIRCLHGPKQQRIDALEYHLVHSSQGFVVDACFQGMAHIYTDICDSVQAVERKLRDVAWKPQQQGPAPRFFLRLLRELGYVGIEPRHDRESTTVCSNRFNVRALLVLYALAIKAGSSIEADELDALLHLSADDQLSSLRPLLRYILQLHDGELGEDETAVARLTFALVDPLVLLPILTVMPESGRWPKTRLCLARMSMNALSLSVPEDALARDTTTRESLPLAVLTYLSEHHDQFGYENGTTAVLVSMFCNLERESFASALQKLDRSLPFLTSNAERMRSALALCLAFTN